MSLTATGGLPIYAGNANNPPPPPPADNGVQDLVTSGWTAAQANATSSLGSAQTLISNLQSVSHLLAGVSSVSATLTQPQPLSIPVISVLSPTATEVLPAGQDAFTNPQQTFILRNIPGMPAVPDFPVAPINTFNTSDIPYSSNMLTDLRARLLEWVDGRSTGILPSVEQAIWDRGRSREIATYSLKAKEAMRLSGIGGFSKPQGSLNIELQSAAQDAQSAISTLSRDVMIKQADLEQSNRRFSMEQAWKMEEALITYTNQQMQRVLEAAKSLQQFSNDLYQHQVSLYGIRKQAESAKISADATIYSAQLSADMEGYKAQVSANVSKYSADSSARASNYNTRVSAEQSKYNAEVSANASEFSAVLGQQSAKYHADVETQIAVANMNIEVSKANVQKMIQQVTIQAEALKAGAQITAQLAASAMSSVNLSGHLGASTSNSASNSVSASVSSSISQNQSVSLGYSYAGSAG